MDVANELSELDQVVQWLMPMVDDLELVGGAEALHGARQLASNVRRLSDAIEHRLAAITERDAVHRVGDLQVITKWRPNRTKWDHDAMIGDLRRTVVFDPATGGERTGSEVWERLAAVASLRGYHIATSKTSSEALASALGLADATELDEYCEIGFKRTVTVEEIPEQQAAA